MLLRRTSRLLASRVAALAEVEAVRRHVAEVGRVGVLEREVELVGEGLDDDGEVIRLELRIFSLKTTEEEIEQEAVISDVD